MKPQKGFTLTELLVSISILAILAAIGIPSYMHYTKKSRFAEIVSATTAVKVGVQDCYNTIGKFAGCNNGILSIPPAIKKGSKLIKSMTVENGVITVVPKPGYGIKRADVYQLTPEVNSTGLIEWKSTGLGADRYAQTDATSAVSENGTTGSKK